MEIVLFVAVFVLVSLSLLLAGNIGPRRTDPGPMCVPMSDLPEGEMHVAELATLSCVLATLSVIIAAALSAA